jgi:hypothetical protein
VPLETYTFQGIDKTTDPTVSTLPRYDWEKLDDVAQQHGLIQISNSTADKHTIQHSPWENLYSTTMFHQLHCVVLLQRAISTLSVPHPRGGQEKKPTAKEFEHLEHCLDFLRQGIMCAGDLSIEVPKRLHDPTKTPPFHVDGWGTKHLCRSWPAMMEWIEQNL